MEVLTALIVGFFGSFHCVGMCGPIALALPVPDASNIKFFSGRILYNFGRVVTYGFMGLILGLIGKQFAAVGFQQIISILLGAFILAILIIPKEQRAKFSRLGFIAGLISPIKKYIGKLFKQGTLPSLFFIGLLNGFLPCGFVYIALAGAVAVGSPLMGMLVMIFFGLGTFPAMFAVSIFGKFITINVRQKISRLTPVFAAVLAVIFILRGMGLGIPYVSPKLTAAPSGQTHQEQMHNCCE